MLAIWLDATQQQHIQILEKEGLFSLNHTCLKKYEKKQNDKASKDHYHIVGCLMEQVNIHGVLDRVESIELLVQQVHNNHRPMLILNDTNEELGAT